MMTAQRRSELKKYMLEHKSASVLEMARRFSVSGQTIRRDFEVLENEGFLLRSYGGAMVKDRKTVTEPNQVKSALFVDEKRAICRLAATRIYPNDCIFIDHSTTALALCPEIRRMPADGAHQLLPGGGPAGGLCPTSRSSPPAACSMTGRRAFLAWRPCGIWSSTVWTRRFCPAGPWISSGASATPTS